MQSACAFIWPVHGIKLYTLALLMFIVCYSESESREEAKKRLEKRLEKRENT